MLLQLGCSVFMQNQALIIEGKKKPRRTPAIVEHPRKSAEARREQGYDGTYHVVILY